MSVIIAAHNEYNHLEKLIPQLLNQEYADFEIIVALDRCSDGSETLVRSYAPRVKMIEIREVPAEWNPKKYALTQAIKASSGEWLVYTDADCYPVSDQWLKTFCTQIGDMTEIVIGVSPYSASGAFLDQYIRFEGFHTAFIYIARALRRRPYMAVGRNMMVKKRLFEKKGGYEKLKHVVGGDDDLFFQTVANPNNTAVILGTNSLVITYPEKSWHAYFLQKLRHLSVATRYRKSDLLFLWTYHTSHLGFLLLLLVTASQQFFLPMLLFYLFIKFVSYRFAASVMGVRINYLWLPVVDIVYAVLTPVIAVWSKLVKDISWKN